MKKILVSGIKPTGEFHFGNYFGAIKQNIELSNSSDYESYVFLADYHALTTLHSKGDAINLHNNTYKAAAAYIACGLNPDNLFRQSSVPEHAELSTIFNNLVSMPYMMRAHAFKDHEAKNKEVNVGLFTYPILMAADILIYDADIVPVGADQKQHVEYARDIAGYFNRAYEGEYFKLPEAHIVEAVGTIPGIDGKKMSKSYDNHIELFCDNEKLKKRIMSIVTDSSRPEDKKNPDENNIYNIHKHFLNNEDDKLVRSKYENASPEAPYSYKEAKEDLLATIIKWREGKVEIYNDLVANPGKIDRILYIGGARAKVMGEDKILKIRKIIGIN